MLNTHHLQLAVLTLLSTGGAVVRVGRSEELREAAEARWRVVVGGLSRPMPVHYRIGLMLDKAFGAVFAACAFVSALSFFDVLS